jgi:TPR repeat protein
VLPQSDTEAFLWAKKAADAGLAKAMYAVGYFLEVGIGTTPNMSEFVWNFPYIFGYNR